ncbi:MAG TPA: hypothetical protein VMF12_04020 [Xanthobacteraceae bacterium]|nr:hypothetical protein [Xanthobacteraceae bacterium]
MSPNHFPDFIQLLKALGPTLVAVVVGGLAGYIGWRQWQTGNYRLRLDMFDRRYAMYEATKLLFGTIAINGSVTSSDFADFREKIRGAEFFFDGEARQFFQRLIDLSWRAYMARSRQKRTKDDAVLNKLFDEEDECLKLVDAEGPNLEKIFSKYLDLSKIGL